MRSNLLTHSRMTSYKTCPRMHYYSYELGIRPDRTAVPLRVGDSVHIGLEWLAKGLGRDEAILKACAKYDGEPPAWAKDDEEALYELAIEREVVARLLSGYVWYWGEADQGIEYLQSEVAFRLPILNPATGRPSSVFEYGGKRDKIIRRPDGWVGIREHKTCSEDLGPESDYWKRLRIDQQISTYYVSALDEGWDIQGVEYDVIRKPTIRPSKAVPVLDEEGIKIVVDANGERVKTKDGKKWRESADAKQGYTMLTRYETPTEFGERLTADIVARPDYYFARRDIPRLAADLQEFREELWQIQQQIRASQNTGRWFRNTAACRQFNRPCAYFDICTNGVDPARDGVPQGYVVHDDVHPELHDEEET